MSCESTTRSASLPAVSEPLRSFSKLSQAFPRVRARSASSRLMGSSGPKTPPVIVSRVVKPSSSAVRAPRARNRKLTRIPQLPSPLQLGQQLVLVRRTARVPDARQAGRVEPRMLGELVGDAGLDIPLRRRIERHQVLRGVDQLAVQRPVVVAADLAAGGYRRVHRDAPQNQSGAVEHVLVTAPDDDHRMVRRHGVEVAPQRQALLGELRLVRQPVVGVRPENEVLDVGLELAPPVGLSLDHCGSSWTRTSSSRPLRARAAPAERFCVAACRVDTAGGRCAAGVQRASGQRVDAAPPLVRATAVRRARQAGGRPATQG